MLSLLLTLNIFYALFWCFIVDVELINADWNVRIKICYRGHSKQWPKGLQHKCFPVDIAKMLRTLISRTMCFVLFNLLSPISHIFFFFIQLPHESSLKSADI